MRPGRVVSAIIFTRRTFPLLAPAAMLSIFKFELEIDMDREFLNDLNRLSPEEIEAITELVMALARVEQLIHPPSPARVWKFCQRDMDEGCQQPELRLGPWKSVLIETWRIPLPIGDTTL